MHPFKASIANPALTKPPPAVSANVFAPPRVNVVAPIVTVPVPVGSKVGTVVEPMMPEWLTDAAGQTDAKSAPASASVKEPGTVRLQRLMDVVAPNTVVSHIPSAPRPAQR
jgi:hypothetical protein